MLVSQVSSANFRASGGNRFTGSTVRFVQPLKNDTQAFITVTEDKVHGIVYFAYRILSGQEPLISKVVTNPEGIKASTYIEMFADIQNIANEDVLINFIRAKRGLNTLS